MENQVAIFSTSLEYEAILMKDKLDEAGIASTILNQRDSTYGTFGSIQLFVLPNDEKIAREIIQKANE